MFDPSIQTFCCYKPGVSSPSLDILSEFNAPSYNIVCLVSSIIGCLGASYQLLPRRDNKSSRRWYSITSVRGKQIIVWLAFADFNASLGVLVRSIFKLNNSMMFHWGQSFQVSICVLVAAWIEYFYMVTWFWTLFYAVDTWLALRQKSGMPKIYHGVSWVLSAVLTFFGLAFLYYPDADCHNYSLMAINAGQIFFRLLPNYITTYLVIASVMIASPILYFVSAKRIDEMVSNCLGQVTKKERSVAQAVRLRFGLINLLFYACWLPNLINGIILWTNWSDLPRNVLLPIWYIMAVMNPLQALFNSIVYRRSSEKIVFPFCRQRTAEETPLLASNINT